MKIFKRKYLLLTLTGGFFFVGVSFKNDFFEIAKQIEIFTTLYKTVNQNYVDKTNPGQLMDKAIKSMLADLDPYTVFFNEQDVVKFKINNTGEYTGIGAILNRKDGHVIIKEVYKNFPADKAGLKAGDEILQIGDIVLKDYKEDTSQLFSGVKNTKIDIVYSRQGKSNKGQIILDEVEVKAVPYYSLLPNNTGYIVLSQFNAKASSETKNALEELKSKGATKIILDLRGNPGGLLGEAVNICNLFIPKNQVIVTTKSQSDKHNNIYQTTKEPIDTEIPLAILIDGRSASASEIVAGALQDYDRAVVVGNRSFGKGLVQRPIDLTYGTQVKVTISRYYTPSGRCIQATDYSKKDEKGNAIKTSEDQFNAFTTKKGRTVYDGGGILPDVIIKESEKSPIVMALIQNDGIFNYITQYYYKNQHLADKTPTITDADFNDLKQWLKKEKFSYNTEAQKSLENAIEVAKKEKVSENVIAQYQNLLTNLKNSNDTELDKNKEQIKKLMIEEIITRFQYKEGLYKYNVAHDSEIKKALDVVNNTNEYNKILKK